MTTPRRRKTPDVPLVEWIAGGISLAIVVGTLLFIGYEIYRGERDLPDLRVEVEAVVPRSGGHAVRVIVRNAGGRPAETVIVEGTAGGVRSQAQIDYVAGESEQLAILVFPTAPDAADLSVRVIGYTTP